jgi:hypothetical protein
MGGQFSVQSLIERLRVAVSRLKFIVSISVSGVGFRCVMFFTLKGILVQNTNFAIEFYSTSIFNFEIFYPLFQSGETPKPEKSLL